ncbi:TetR/AcrR family transcriptional regulator [Naumannella sp. ID2617S]|nr:TetR/AcrR family transcriptional regulator [Naumannella sp. ID2617S]
MHSQDAGRAQRALWELGGATRGPRARFTVREVARAAVSLADTSGLEAVSLAAVAERLGVATTALYRYVDSREELTEVMVDEALGAAPELSEGPWQDRVTAWSDRLWRRHAAHPWLCEVQLSRLAPCPAPLAWLEEVLRCLEQAPVERPLALALMLDGLATSYARLRGSRSPEQVPQWLATLLGERFPRLASALADNDESLEQAYAEAVQVALDGAVRRS